MAEWIHAVYTANATVRYYLIPIPDPVGVVTIHRREIMDPMTLTDRTLTIHRREIMDSIVLTK